MTPTLYTHFDGYRWITIDTNTYDGAPDATTRHHIGVGRTKAEAEADWWDLYEEYMEGQS
jgi:hypothetical protein